jgi:hypothetical protein
VYKGYFIGGKIMKMTDCQYTNAYAMALAQFNLMQKKQENESLKTTAGATVPIPAYMFLPVSKPENVMPNCFEPTKPPEDDEYKKGWLDGWIACTEYFIKK